jgi:16S rRNA processing protein RimM
MAVQDRRGTMASDARTGSGTALPPWDDLIVVGRIARTHGRRGEVILNSESDFPEDRFRAGNRLLVQRVGRIEALSVASAWFQKGRPVVAFEGVETMNDAEELAGLELRIPVEELAPLPPGVYYHHELVGCRVETAGGEVVGEVSKVDGSGVTSLLVVKTPGGEELIPLVDNMCRVIDPGARRIVIAAPDGLLGLNETARSRGERRGGRR